MGRLASKDGLDSWISGLVASTNGLRLVGCVGIHFVGIIGLLVKHLRALTRNSLNLEALEIFLEIFLGFESRSLPEVYSLLLYAVNG